MAQTPLKSPRTTAALVLTLTILAWAAPGLAHFGVLTPQTNIVAKDGDKTVRLDLRFWHPMENSGMNLAKPRLEVFAKGRKTDLSAGLKEGKAGEFTVWSGACPVKAPGDLVFLMTPQPYWEQAEDKYIQHLTKTVVGVLGDEQGWDKPVGAKMEIVPLTRPYGLYAPGNFAGRVLYKGKPLAGADVEVEFLNSDGALKAPADPYVTLALRTDAAGQFQFTAPWAGWWGFSALAEDDAKIKKDGKDKKVELGGVIWVYFHQALK
jgi:cobalt/nickel transport protein